MILITIQECAICDDVQETQPLFFNCVVCKEGLCCFKCYDRLQTPKCPVCQNTKIKVLCTGCICFLINYQFGVHEKMPNYYPCSGERIDGKGRLFSLHRFTRPRQPYVSKVFTNERRPTDGATPRRTCIRAPLFLQTTDISRGACAVALGRMARACVCVVWKVSFSRSHARFTVCCPCGKRLQTGGIYLDVI